MEKVECSICHEEKNKQDCIKTVNTQNEKKVCCKECRPEYDIDIKNLWKNPKIKLANLPIKRI